MAASDWHGQLLEDGPVWPRRRPAEAADLDITPMIDVTFLLLVFFLVASRPDPQTAVDLPPARHGTAVSAQGAVVLTVARPAAGEEVAVYGGDGKRPETLLSAADDLAGETVARYVRREALRGKTTVLIKAEKGVRHRQVLRVAEAAVSAGLPLHVAVFEVP